MIVCAKGKQYRTQNDGGFVLKEIPSRVLCHVHCQKQSQPPCSRYRKPTVVPIVPAANYSSTEIVWCVSILGYELETRTTCRYGATGSKSTTNPWDKVSQGSLHRNQIFSLTPYIPGIGIHSEGLSSAISVITLNCGRRMACRSIFAFIRIPVYSQTSLTYVGSSKCHHQVM